MLKYKIFCPFLALCLTILSCESNTERLDDFQVHGIDVSHYQNTVNWDTVAVQNISFAFVKATEGKSVSDSLFCRNWSELSRLGIKKGAYHFFHPDTDVKSQFANFKNLVEMENGDLPPVLDVEISKGKTKAEIIEQIRIWLELAEKEYKIKPIIYTNLKYYKAVIAGNFDQHPIWIAKYSDHEPVLDFGDSWTFWQYGNRGRIAGIMGDVDFNVFNGDHVELDKICYDESRFTSQLIKSK